MYKDMQYIDVHTNIPELYKPLIFICIGVWEWAIVLSILKWQHINVNTLIHATSTKSSQIKPLLLYAFYMTLIILFHILILENSHYFKLQQHHAQFGPVIFCYSLHYYGHFDRSLSAHVYLSDIVAADILISFSVIFTGIFTHLIQDTHISHTILIPIISSVPYLIRLKQCLNEYSNSILLTRDSC